MQVLSFEHNNNICYLFHYVVHKTNILTYMASFNKACLIRRSASGMEVLVSDVLQIPWQQS